MDSCCACYDDYTISEDANYLPADHLIITYQFDRIGGRDLDTRTKLTYPRQSLTLGCGFNSSDNGIYWSGDNQGYGVESCHIDLTSFAPNETIKIDCKAFWHSQKNSGDMSIDVRAYQGGSMTKSGFQFINVGGEETGFLSFADNISRKISCGSHGEAEDIGEIVYHKPSQTLYFNQK